jgi:hypothetical protein
MKLAKFVALLGAVAQGGILIYGFMQGDFAAAGQFFFKDPWGIVSLVDVYVGFMFFSAWIIFREKNPLVALLWVIAIIILGNFPAGVYAFLALQKSGGSWNRFWMGERASLNTEV